MNPSRPNRLAGETSPYLLQHAHNPVDWYPWGPEALERAQETQRPILVSIGYSACHWCHVMERESFEDLQTAELMNTHFINIKIDREERPDLDHIYMDAVQAMTGSGGWPLNVFLTPDLKPFFGGTYFPPVRAHNRASWKEVLEGVRKAFEEKRDDIDLQAERLTDHLKKSNAFGMSTPDQEKKAAFFQAETLHTIAANLLQQADTEEGGFGRAPKFPQTFSIRYLLRHYRYYGDEKALAQALLSLDKMWQGGIYDHVGGGFARYSVDSIWQVPHFEKMLYDNALLVEVLAEAYQITRRIHYRLAIEQTLDFVLREMTDPEGGFYSALDADSEGVEGKFYTWSVAELESLLGSDAKAFMEMYQVEAAGNWPEGTHEAPPSSILWLRQLPTPEEEALMNRCRPLLMAARAKRVRPLTDDKLLLGWNALMNLAFVKAYAVTGNQLYLDTAIRNMAFLEKRFQGPDAYWKHVYKADKASFPAFLDDLSYLTAAYLRLQPYTGDTAFLLKAKATAEQVLDHFQEKETGLFFYTPDYQTDVLLRKKEVYDGAVPSGNAVMAEQLWYLSLVFDRPDWEELSRSMLASLSEAVVKYPGSFGVWAGLLQLMVQGSVEIVAAGQQAAFSLYPIQQTHIPQAIVVSASASDPRIPLLTGKSFPAEGTLFYLCRDKSCLPPFDRAESLLANV